MGTVDCQSRAIDKDVLAVVGGIVGGKERVAGENDVRIDHVGTESRYIIGRFAPLAVLVLVQQVACRIADARSDGHDIGAAAILRSEGDLVLISGEVADPGRRDLAVGPVDIDVV